MLTDNNDAMKLQQNIILLSVLFIIKERGSTSTKPISKNTI